MNLPAPDPQLVVDAMLDDDHPIKRATADWARAEFDFGDLVANDAGCVFAREAWKSCADAGLNGITVPTEMGGAGNDMVTVALKLEGLGLGCRDNGLAYAFASQMLSFQDALVRFASVEQRASVLEPALSGDLLGAFAITETGSGSDTFAMATRAARTNRGWRLDGSKAHITLAPVADVAIVFAATDPEAGVWGISAFLVHRDRPGVEFSSTRPKMGLRTTPYGDITLDGYEATDDDLLGAEGAGSAIFNACMDSERGLIMSTHLGAAERVIHEAIDRANNREQFGQSIGSFQAVSHRLVDMKMRHETARLLLYKAAARIGRGGNATLAAAMAKLEASEAVASIALDAQRVHGARGYMSELEVEREVRDALGGLVYSGTSDIQRNLIGSLLGIATGRRTSNIEVQL